MSKLVEELLPVLLREGLVRDTSADQAEVRQLLLTGAGDAADWRRVLERATEPVQEVLPAAASSLSSIAVTEQPPVRRAKPLKSRLAKLEISHFRGVGTARFRVDFRQLTKSAREYRSLAVLWGENGTGKSTVLDALDLVCRRAVGSVAERFEGATREELWQHLPALGHTPAEVVIRLTMENGDVWTAALEEELDESGAAEVELDASASKAATAAPSGRLQLVVRGQTATGAPTAAPPHVRVLRRNRLLRLLEAPPGEQFVQIRSFVGMEAGERCERTLGELLSELEQVVFATEGDTLRQPFIQLYDRARRAAEILRQHRHRHANELLVTVTAQAKKYYAVIHPDEQIYPERWWIEGDDQLTAAGYYRGRSVRPQAIFSESHLDTLGFCYWLALAHHAAPEGNAILLLDDVFTSVDTPHLRRITELLGACVAAKGDFKHHFRQIIIATHHPLWAEFYRRSGVQSVWLRFYRGLPGEVVVHPERTFREELREELARTHNFDPVTATGKAGILLERLYDDIALRYEVKLTRKTSGYTLADFGEARSKLSELTVTLSGVPAAFPRSLATICAELQRLEFIRNAKGAHYNPEVGLHLAESDAHEFAAVVLELADQLHCPHCGRMPEGRGMTCGCPTPTGFTPLPTR